MTYAHAHPAAEEVAVMGAPDSDPAAEPGSAVPLAAVPADAIPVAAVPADAIPVASAPVNAVPAAAVPAETVPAGAVPVEADRVVVGPADAIPVAVVPSAAVPAPRAAADPPAAGGLPVAGHPPVALSPAAPVAAVDHAASSADRSSGGSVADQDTGGRAGGDRTAADHQVPGRAGADRTAADPAGPVPVVPRQRGHGAAAEDIGEAIERLVDEHPAAAQLLCLCAVLHPAPVPVDVFTRSLPVLPRPLGGVAPLQFNGLVAALVEPGLVQRGSQGLRVPEPVRAAVRDDLGEQAAGVCREYAGSLVAAAVPDQVAEPSTWPRWAALAPHLIASDAAHSTDPALRAAACSLVVSLLHRGKARPARTIAAELHTGWRETLGPDHPDTLRCAHELARSLVAAGALLPARRLLDDTVDRLVGTLGTTHPQTRVAAETRRGVLLRMGGKPRPGTLRGKAAHRRRKQP